MTGAPPVTAPASRVADDLWPGEALAWAGRPRVAPAVLRSLPLAAMGLVFVTIGVGVVAGSLTWDGPWDLGGVTFALVMVGFGGIGLVLVGGPFWAYHRARRTVYTLTDCRAIVREPIFPAGFQVQTFPLEQARRAARRLRGGGRGDLVFEDRSITTRSGLIRHDRQGFLDLDDVRSVESLIHDTSRPLPTPCPSQGR